jgi:hypothetical protein
MDRKQRYIQKLRTRDIPSADKKVVIIALMIQRLPFLSLRVILPTVNIQ